MAKGSQLSQLKSALAKADLSRTSHSKKRKSASAQPRDKNERTAKIQEIHEKLNPFDLKVTKLKHDVGGRKIKGAVGRPLVSRQAGLEKRKKTLLVEYDQKSRTGGIVDRRFGENDPTMAPEERMLERFTKERQRASRGTAFNLEDEDDLTHFGQSLSNMDDFDGIGLALDDEEEDGPRGQIDAQTVRRAHFGGFEEEEDDEQEDGQPPRKKSKAEVMAEVIAKSKEHKFQRQLEKESEEQIRHQLDDEFASIQSLLFAPKGPEDTEAGEAGSVTQTPSSEPLFKESASNPYNQIVRELAFDARSKPKDRTKTEEELALEEKERLEKAEHRRLKRMAGEPDSESEDEGDRGRRKHKRERGGDDLEDDFMEEDAPGALGSGLGATLADKVGEDESEEGEDEDGEDEDEDASEEAESGPEEFDVEDADADEMAKEPRSSKGNQKAKAKAASSELPFTFPCPESHDDFLEIIDGVDEKDVVTVIKRLRALYHPSLAEGNKLKQQTLQSVLLEHMLHLTSQDIPRFDLVNSLLADLRSLTEAYPTVAAENFREKLSTMQKNFARGLSKGVMSPEARTWPGPAELTLLRVIGDTWSTSDMDHPVVSPARLLMASYLGLCRLRSLRDVASGLFLCTLFFSYEKMSGRLVPEVINFLLQVMLHLAPHPFTSTSLPNTVSCPDLDSDFDEVLKLKPELAAQLEFEACDLPNLMQASSPVNEQSKINLLGACFRLISHAADVYKDLEGYPELLKPVSDIIGKLQLQQCSSIVRKRQKNLHERLEKSLTFALEARHPLVLQAHKPIPIATYTPRFSATSSSYIRNQDPDRDRAAASKLRRELKEERRGAMRELRKDAKFLAGVRAERQAEKDRKYNSSMKRVFGSIEGERAEEKAMEREKNKEKKRAGRGR